MKSWLGKRMTGRSASRWFARLHAGDLSDGTDESFQRWLDRSPRNEQELEHRELVWEMLGELQNDPEMAELTRATAMDVRERQNRRTTRAHSGWRIAVAAATLAALVIGYWQFQTPAQRKVFAATEQVFTTGKGEQKRIVLADGSRIALNTATRLRVQYTGQLRHLSLDGGEAVFSVRPDERRPFEVSAGETRTQALGTTFNVLYLNGETGISVLEGRIRVAAASGPADQHPVELSTGQATTYTPRGGLGPVAPADLARITSWQMQRVEFKDVTLHEAVNEFNRYSTTRVVIGDPLMENVQVSGIFHFDDIDAFTKGLRGAFGIRSRREGQVVVLLPSSDTAR